MKRLLLLLLIASSLNAFGQHTFLKRSTDVACLLPAAAGVAFGIYADDKQGLFQLGLSEASTLAVNYALELCIRKKRPDGTGNHAFPSTHTAIAFAGASYLQKRYGWQFGVPAYAVAGFVAWGRVKAERHDVWDVLAGAAIGTTCGLLLTHRYSPTCTMTAAPMVTPEGAQGITVNVTF